MAALKPRLAIIAGRPVTLDQHPEWNLPECAAAAYPHSSHLQAEWCKARQYLGKRGASVEIGRQRCDTSRAFRSLREAGVHQIHEPVDVPAFLSRLLRA